VAGRADGVLELPAPGAPSIAATAFAADRDTVVVLLGAGPAVEVSRVADVCLLLPLVSAVFRGEAVSVAAEAQAAVAREAVAETKLLAASLDHARAAVKRAPRRSD
jgi:hypothetical protein